MCGMIVVFSSDQSRCQSPGTAKRRINMGPFGVDDVIECTHATSSGMCSVPIEVGWQGNVQSVNDYGAFVVFQVTSEKRTIELWIRASDFGKFVTKTGSTSMGEESENEADEFPSDIRQYTAEELNARLEAVGGF